MFYVNAALSGMTVSDCTTPSNTDCGLDNAIDAFNADTTPDDADGIVLEFNLDVREQRRRHRQHDDWGVAHIRQRSGNHRDYGRLVELVFRIQGNAVSISNVTVEDGSALTCGGVDNEDGSLDVSDDVFTNDAEQDTDGGASLTTTAR